MSSDVMSRGLMAPILNPVDQDERDDLTERMWEDGSPLHISYDGTLAWIEISESDGYGLSFGVENECSPEELGLAGIVYDLHIALDQARPFSCLWYDGADSDMSMLSVKEFLKRTDQE